jgi:prolyl 4-hydroxylase
MAQPSSPVRGKARPTPDRKALATVGASVRERLARDPSVYRVPVERAEIFAVADFLDAGECAHLMGLVDAVARPSELTRDVEDDYRTSYSGDVDRLDPVVRSVERRFYDLLGIDDSWGETIQGQRYHPGQQFKQHCDWFDVTQPYWRTESAQGGQRSWTGMVYLNEVEEGGTTEFTRIGVTVPPQAGALLLWNNNLPDGTVNWDTMHAALPVVRGAKYVITKWFRSRRWG